MELDSHIGPYMVGAATLGLTPQSHVICCQLCRTHWYSYALFVLHRCGRMRSKRSNLK